MRRFRQRYASGRSISLLVFSAVLFAGQAPAATLHGVVRDPKGQPIARSRILVFARDHGEQITAIANSQGEYRIERLAGEYLVQAESPGLERSAAKTAELVGTADVAMDFTLGLAEIRTEILVTATGAPQSTDEIAKAVDLLRASDLVKNAEFSATEPLRSVPGIQLQTLGGPGAFTRILTRGLRPQDTAITIDGLRFRDAATTQGDATPFLENLFLIDTERIEVLRGTGSSIYGSNAIGGVVNVVTDEGGGPLHGELRAEGGGLGTMRGLARLAGGALNGKVNFSAGLQHLNVTRGVDGDDRYRNSSAQGSLQYRSAASASLTARLWAGDGFAQINSTPYAAPASALPPRGTIEAAPVSLDVQHRIEAGLPFSFGSANFVPALNDPDSRRSSRFLSAALIFSQQLNPRISYRLTYHNVITRRWFDDGPAGVRFPPKFNVSDRIRGGIDTAEGRADIKLTGWNLLSAGYEFERETYDSAHVDFAPAPVGQNYFTGAGQRSHNVFFSDQSRLFHDRLQISFSGRLQNFSLRSPVFEGGASRYTGLNFQAPPRAKTGDIAVAYFLARSGTKLRAHTGNGYRAPSIFERFGSSFFDGSFSPLGDPRLHPDRTVAFDTGLDQYLLGQKLRVSATWFYTNLQEVIAFDSSGFLRPAADPFGRSSGYINMGGGISRGAEVGMEASPFRSLRINAAYTYTNSGQRRSTVTNRDFFRVPFISANQFTVTATQQIGPRVDITGSVWIASDQPAIFSNRAFLFSGPRKVDIAANYTIPVNDHWRVRTYTKLSNILDSQYLQGGYRVPGRWGMVGLSFQF
jgi:vitamin B12 transporter